ncbi:MAG: DNA primase, partial [Nanoarchaeota archaeon]|nr:DNA primase [Nanoarchaeota archaeon]
DENMKVLGKVPSTEIENTLRSLKNIHTIIFDGEVTKDLAYLAEKNGVKYLIGMSSKVTGNSSVNILTTSSF